ncbi:ribonuclease III [Murdochiella vaginalis]|uniref:ribonuclease III n=1 Tax=Murdochiella vaginalis TaxID=1852373 RepID=UPI0008FE1BC9|nr:ribonuclease III [Murdochiella vaginalis]
MSKSNLDHFQERLGYRFQHPDLLQQAMIHRSVLNERPNEAAESNERLEFLGDAVLELITTDHFFRRYPKDPEGELSRKRALAVCEASFAEIGREIGIDSLLQLGHGEEMQGGREKPSLLADAFEALCGAIYLDGGMNFLSSWFVQKLEDMHGKLEASSIDTDAKSALHRYVLRHGLSQDYVVLEESGPSHQRTFRVAVEINGKRIAEGSGKSKKRAEAQAAHAALMLLNKNMH